MADQIDAHDELSEDELDGVAGGVFPSIVGLEAPDDTKLEEGRTESPTQTPSDTTRRMEEG